LLRISLLHALERSGTRGKAVFTENSNDTNFETASGNGSNHVVVGDIDETAEKSRMQSDEAREANADIVTFPELALTGYPPEDLLLKPQFIEANLRALDKLAESTRGITAIVGFVDRQDTSSMPQQSFRKGKSSRFYHKMFLPNYGSSTNSATFSRQIGIGFKTSTEPRSVSHL